MLQVYIKRGKGLADPFITLRHAEWGHSQAFNLVLNSWTGERLLISSNTTAKKSDNNKRKEGQCNNR